MSVTLVKKKESVDFEITNNTGSVIHSGASPDLGGTGTNFRPMDTVLAGLAGCSSVDVCLVLGKQRQPIDSLVIKVDSIRSEEVPSVFEKITLNFELEGDIEPAKLQRAVDLSVNKYCSVAAMLHKTADISYTIKLNGNEI